MIRINLLPRKVSKKKAGLIQHLVLAGLLLVVFLIGLTYFWLSLNSEISNLNSQLAAAEAEKESLKNVNQEKENYEKSIAELKSKLDIITEIQKGRFVPVRLLDELTKVLDRATPVWLEKYSYIASGIQMDGYSLSNPDLARFVTRLEESPFYQEVELIVSEKIERNKRQIFRFSLRAKLQEQG